MKRYHFEDWGVWAGQFGKEIFGAFVRQDLEERTSFDGSTYFRQGKPFGLTEGTPTGHNPVAGSAVWSGVVRAFEAGLGIESFSEVNYTPVSGRAQLEVDFSDTTIDVDFTDFEAGHGNLSWRALQLRNGVFRDGEFGIGFFSGDAIQGAFYGDEHQGAAGTFERGGLQGIFGTIRD